VNKLELYSRVVMLGWLAGWGKVSMVVRGARIDKQLSSPRARMRQRRCARPVTVTADSPELPSFDGCIFKGSLPKQCRQARGVPIPFSLSRLLLPHLSIGKQMPKCSYSSENCNNQENNRSSPILPRIVPACKKDLR